jgi:hypothetical protein
MPHPDTPRPFQFSAQYFSGHWDGTFGMPIKRSVCLGNGDCGSYSCSLVLGHAGLHAAYYADQVGHTAELICLWSGIYVIQEESLV